MDTILIVDDDDQLRKSFEKLLQEEGYTVMVAASGEQGIEIVKQHTLDLAILDIRLPGMSGLETFGNIHEIEPKLPVIIMTAFGNTETAIEATKMGAFEYILKPFDIPEMLGIIQKALDTGRCMRRPVAMDVPADRPARDAIIGRSHSMQDVYKAIGKVAATSATVLIRGESGTGKELAARAIYQHSDRCDKPFLVINCVAIPETLLESELFGYEKGAFTGATHRRIGKLEQANGGTVFLDEIGDMPSNLQSKILRLLQEKSIERLGGRQTIPVDVRIIAATNRNLEESIKNGRFREDLYYRLKVVSIWLPPLHERREDIPLLTAYFLSRHSRQIGIKDPGITKEAMNLLCRNQWRGNVRELSNTIHKTLIFNRGAPLSVEDVAAAIEETGPGRETDRENWESRIEQWARHRLNTKSGDSLFDASMDQVAAILIREAIKFTGGNRSRAAKLLGMSRPTLHSKIDKYHLKLETMVTEEK